MFELTDISENLSVSQINDTLKEHNALLALVLPANFSEQIIKSSDKITNNALIDLGFSELKKDKSSEMLRRENLNQFLT